MRSYDRKSIPYPPKQRAELGTQKVLLLPQISVTCMSLFLFVFLFYYLSLFVIMTLKYVPLSLSLSLSLSPLSFPLALLNLNYGFWEMNALIMIEWWKKWRKLNLSKTEKEQIFPWIMLSLYNVKTVSNCMIFAN